MATSARATIARTGSFPASAGRFEGRSSSVIATGCARFSFARVRGVFLRAQEENRRGVVGLEDLYALRAVFGAEDHPSEGQFDRCGGDAGRDAIDGVPRRLG